MKFKIKNGERHNHIKVKEKKGFVHLIYEIY
jgi:hypothetical protein